MVNYLRKPRKCETVHGRNLRFSIIINAFPYRSASKPRAASHRGVFCTLIETVKTNGHNPRLWLTLALKAIGRERGLTGCDALLPWTCH